MEKSIQDIFIVSLLIIDKYHIILQLTIFISSLNLADAFKMQLVQNVNADDQEKKTLQNKLEQLRQ